MASKLATLVALVCIVASLSITSMVFAQSSSSAKLVFLSDAGGDSIQLYAVNPDGTSLQYLTNTLGDLQVRDVGGASCSSDGSYIVFSARGLHRIESDGSNLTGIVNEGLYFDPALSPDGSYIAYSGLFISPDDSPSELYISPSNGSHAIRLTNSPASEASPSWSPDGKIVFSYQEGDTTGISIIDNNGSGLVQLTQILGFEGQPDWSPDGQKIAFTSDRNGNLDIYSMNPDGSGLQQLTSDTGNNTHPRWSPNGDMISFTSDRDGIKQIYLMNNDGTNQQRVTYDNNNNINQCWLVNNNNSPTANAGPDQTLSDSDSDGFELVTLDGSASFDPDGEIVSYVWTLNGVEIATGVSPQVNLSVGVQTITLMVTDNDGLTDDDQVTITILPASAPTTFPETEVLDDFNRTDGGLGGDWLGTTGSYGIVGNQVAVTGDGDIYWNAAAFSADQEVFVTLAEINPNAEEIDLLLKRQGTGWQDGVLEVWYAHPEAVCRCGRI